LISKANKKSQKKTIEKSQLLIQKIERNNRNKSLTSTDPCNCAKSHDYLKSARRNLKKKEI